MQATRRQVNRRSQMKLVKLAFCGYGTAPEMSDLPEEWAFLEPAWRYALILTGCPEGATQSFADTVEEIRRHPHPGDAHRTMCLFFSTLRRRCLRFPAHCALSEPAAGLHRQVEPARSVHALLALPALSATDVQRVLELDAKSLSRLQETDPLPPEARQEIRELPLSEAAQAQITAAARTLEGSGAHDRHLVRNPATIAVGIGFLLLIAILVWNFLGQAGVFPDEAIKIATAGAKASPEQFEALEEKAGALQDWFMLKGYDDFRVPPEFANFMVAGVRSFKVENEPIAQAAVPENVMYFYSFAARPFGIHIAPEGSWRITEADRTVLAIREEAGTCFLIAFRGTKADMERVLSQAGVRR